MALNTYPYSPFPASTEQLHKGDNEELQAQIDAIKDGADIDSFGDVETALGVVTGDITNLETDKADLEVVAPAFDAEAGTYDVGDQVTYDGKLYEFTSAHSTAGAWDPTEVTEKTVADEIGTVKSGLTNEENRDKVFIFEQNIVSSVLSFTGTAIPRALLAQIIIVGQYGVTSTVNVSTKGSTTDVNLASTRIYISNNDYNITSSGEDDGKVNIAGNVLGGWGKIYVRGFSHAMDNASVSITYGS